MPTYLLVSEDRDVFRTDDEEKAYNAAQAEWVVVNLTTMEIFDFELTSIIPVPEAP